ncbi:MAG: L,D-transpeptidase [Solirubrobacterales bacterium]
MKFFASTLIAFAVALVLPGGQASASTSLQRGSETHWAHPSKLAPIRISPTQGSRQVTFTRFRTEDGYPEVYIALRKWTDRHGQTWIRVRIPMRPNGRIGWVRRFALGPLYQVNTKLVVNRSRGAAALYRHGRRIWKAPVGTGKQNTPTPPGTFWVREKFATRDAQGPYGPVAFGTSDYSVLTDWPGGGVIGIHGTDQPGLIPGRPSHGCIRVRNGAIRRLYGLMPVGTPILIR